MLVSFEVVKGDLFSDLKSKQAPHIILHANNSKGRWGHGVAVCFAKRFPCAYKEHRERVNRVGDGYFLSEGLYRIGCLITSKGYGVHKDPPSVILEHTDKSIENLLLFCPEDEITIHSPKINAGLFNVPWQKTKSVIKEVCEKSYKKVWWVVWEL